MFLCQCVRRRGFAGAGWAGQDDYFARVIHEGILAFP